MTVDVGMERLGFMRSAKLLSIDKIDYRFGRSPGATG